MGVFSKNKLAFALSLAAAFALSGSIALAQIPSLTQVLSIASDPETPGPNQTVTLTLSDYLTDLNSSQVAWYQDGKLLSKSVGLKTLTIQTGKVGTQTRISVVVTGQDGSIMQKSLTLAPEELSIAWQAVSYVPPFYKGKAMYSQQGDVKFVALPSMIDSNGAKLPSSQLSYKWTKDGEVQGDSSGYGKDTFSVPGAPVSRPVDIKVEATAPASGVTASAEIVLAPQTPKVMLYEDDALYGIRDEAAVTSVLSVRKPEITIVAVPYFFTTKTGLDSLTYSWSINTSAATGLDKTRSVVLRPNGSSGYNVSLSVANSAQLLQSASASFTTNFLTK